MKSKLKKIMQMALIVISVLVIGILIFLQHPLFGKNPTGDRLERIKKSKQYKDGSFQNQSLTPSLTEGVSYTTAIKDMLFSNIEHLKPLDSIPHIKTDLSKLNTTEDFLVWFGHSSYYMQLEGKSFLVDPVLTDNASPIYGTNISFLGANTYTTEQIPVIDYLIITHDHYDHLDYTSFKNLKEKVAKIICPLGVGSHLEYWGFNPKNIIELDWYEGAILEKNIQITSTPSRHFSGRGFTRNNTLWSSYVLKTAQLNLFLGGDSGYDTHFSEIGSKYGPFDLALLENGQYDYKWKYIHMFPEEVVKASADLKSKRFFPIHSSKFKLANHPWKEPLEKVKKASDSQTETQIITPKIGEIVYLNQTNQLFSDWWKNIN